MDDEDNIYENAGVNEAEQDFVQDQEEPQSDVEDVPAPPVEGDDDDPDFMQHDNDETITQTVEVEYYADNAWETLDTTAEQHKRDNRDLQGIPWESTLFSRASYRQKRNEEYRSYYNLASEVKAAAPRIAAEAVRAQEIDPSCTRYQFFRNWRAVRPFGKHFQLRNLIYPTTAHDLYFVERGTIKRWNNLSATLPSLEMDVSGDVPNAVAPGLGSVHLCTMCAKHGIIAGGGMHGEVLVKKQKSHWKKPFEASLRVANFENGITNAIDCYKDNSSGALRLVCSNNDEAVRVLDVETGCSIVGMLKLPWAVNCTVVDGEGKLFCSVGDDVDGFILDSRLIPQNEARESNQREGNEQRNRAVIAKLRGHCDYSFAAAWHPAGTIIATGNQDLTTRIFDLRNPKRAMAVLPAHIGAVRALRFSPDGRTLAVAECADYVSLYDVTSGYTRKHTVDVFGEIAGVGFSPCGERLFVGISDSMYASLMQFNLQRHYS